MQMCQPLFEKTSLLQQPIDTWLAHLNNNVVAGSQAAQA